MARTSAFLKRSAPRLLVWALAAAAGPLAVAADKTAEKPAGKPADKAPAVNAACSVHLYYNAPKSVAFYNEITVEKSAPGSYFSACGFQSGYFGMQELANGKKVVIFSVWDSPAGDNPNAVAKEKQAEVLHQGEEVQVSRFGGEGTGQKSMWSYDWKNDQAYRFLVKAVTVDGKPSFAAYFFVPETKAWKHLATFHTPHNDRHIDGYYSFAEDFRRNTASVELTRRALFGNGAVCDAQGVWRSLDQASFGASRSRTEARDKIDAGAADTGFFLQTGGDTKTHTRVGTQMRHKAKAALPTDLPKE